MADNKIMIAFAIIILVTIASLAYTYMLNSELGNKVSAVQERAAALENRKFNCDESYFDAGKTGNEACAETGKQCIKVSEEQTTVYFASNDFSCNSVQSQNQQIVGLSCGQGAVKNYADASGKPRCNNAYGAEPYNGDTWISEFFKVVCCTYS